MMNANKNSRQGFKSMGPTAIKKVLKLDSTINGGSSQEALSKALTTASNSTKCLERSKIAPVSSSILSEEGEKTLLQKKSGSPRLHSGVFFCDNNKKSTVPKPFAFETRMKLLKSQSTANDENSQISSSDSVLSHDISSCKESFSVMKAKSEIKTQNGSPRLHSGVFFYDNNKKSTVPKPFAFESRMKLLKSQSTANDENSQISSSDSVSSHDISSCKESFSVMKAKSEIKTQNVMKVKSLTSKKAMGGSNRNTVIGSPLSENRNRNEHKRKKSR